MANFAEILLRKRVISQEQLAEAKKLSKESRKSVGEELIRLGYASGDDVMRAMAQEHGLDFVDLNEVVIPPSIVELVPESVARENAVLPLGRRRRDAQGHRERSVGLRHARKAAVHSEPQDRDCLAPREIILEAINKHYGQMDGESADSMLQEFTDTAIDFTETAQEAAAATDEVVDETSAPIVRLVQLIISEAVQLRASDIHIEPFEDRVRIRYRIDGVLVERDSPPRRLRRRLLSRFKILAKMDIAERRRPQDGRIKVNAGDKELDLRVSVLPTNHGQSVRDAAVGQGQHQGRRAAAWACRRATFRQFKSLIRRPNGIILVTGPTGSGKTTTLYAALNELNRPDRKIITAEDPVEYYLPGINQVEVRHSIGLDFARSSGRCCGRHRISSWSARCAMPRRHRWEFRHL